MHHMVIKIKNAISMNNGGGGFKFSGVHDIDAENLQAIGNKGPGFSFSVPGTKINLSAEELERAKEILKNTPESKWPERLQTLKAVADLGTDAAVYIPAVIAFVRSQIGL